MAINTETEVHEYHLITSNRHCGQTAQEIYTRAYNAGKSDAIREFVDMVRKDVKKLPHEMGFISRDDVSTILTKRMDEVFKKQISKILEEEVINK